MLRHRKQRLLWLLMALVIAMTATPLVVLANRITPAPLGIPFFLLWCAAVPLSLWILMLVHSRMVPLDSDEEEHS